MFDLVKAKRNYLMALALLFVVVSLSGTTYSLFINSDSTNTFGYSTGIIDLKITEDKPITMESAFPMIDSQGIKTDPYTLTITNIGSLPYLFDLKMLSDGSDNTISGKYIKVMINDELPRTLFELENTIKKQIIIYPNEEIIFKIKIWLDIDTPNAELGKTYSAKITTTGTALYKTLDTSNANHPQLKDKMLPIYYDETNKEWKKADESNLDSSSTWYNYNSKQWANVAMIKNSNKSIYDITGKNNLPASNSLFNSSNLIIDDLYFDIGQSSYQSNQISNIFKIKTNHLEDNLYFITNGNISYYYDTTNSKFTFKVKNQQVSSTPFELQKDIWYVIGYTYDQNKVKFYVNGTKISESILNGNIYSSESFKIGTSQNKDDISKMTVSNIYLYNDIVTEEEFKNLNIQSIITDNLICGYKNFTAMTLYEYYMSLPLGTSINDNDIQSYYVWIPRFKYKLWNVTGKPKTDSYDAYNKGIDIVFEKGTNSTGTIYCDKHLICYNDKELTSKVTANDNGKYYTHPAFTNLDQELSGIWVSKYEISNFNNKEIISKPNTQSLANISLATYYNKIKTSGNNYYMIKNSDWGAISYLTHSKYGVCSNNICKETSSNNDTSSGNIYGIYNLSYGNKEFVMANYTSTFGEISLNDQQFSNIPISNQDYDLYYNNTFILGDATKEVTIDNNTTWYNNSAIFIFQNKQWFTRGGTGMFTYNQSSGNESNDTTTRIVIK